MCVCGICCSAVRPAARTVLPPRHDLATRTDRTASTTALRQHLTATAMATTATATKQNFVCLPVGIARCRALSLTHTQMQLCGNVQCTIAGESREGGQQGAGG